MKNLIIAAGFAGLICLLALPAHAALWGLNAIGIGTESDDCTPSSQSCAVEMITKVNGNLDGTAYSKATFDVMLTVANTDGTGNGSGGYCYPASGTGTLVGLPGGTINLATVGMLCDMNGASTQGYYGTYFIAGGVSGKKNVNATGTGNVAASIESTHRLNLTIFGVFQR